MISQFFSIFVSFSKFAAFGLSTVGIPSLILYYHFSHPRTVPFADPSRLRQRSVKDRHKFHYAMAGFVSTFYCLVYFGIARTLDLSGLLQDSVPLQQFALQLKTSEFWALVIALVWGISTYVIVLRNINVSSGKRYFISTYLCIYLLLAIIPMPGGKAAIDHFTNAYSELNIFDSLKKNEAKKTTDAGPKSTPIKNEGRNEPDKKPDDDPKVKEKSASASGTLADTARFLFFAMLVYVVLKYFTDIYFERQKEAKISDVDAFDLAAILKAVEYFLWLLSAMAASWFIGVNLLSLGLFSGLIGAGLTIAFRDLLNNLFSGLFLHWDNSIQIGAVIRTHDGIVGEVKKISLRYTFLSTPDNRDILIPNSSLASNQFENFTRTKSEVRLSLKFELAQSADIFKVRELAEGACLSVPEVAAAAGRSPGLFYMGPERGVHKFDLRFWVNNPRIGPGKLRSLVAYEIFKKFKEENIPLPVYRVDSTFAFPEFSEPATVAPS